MTYSLWRMFLCVSFVLLLASCSTQTTSPNQPSPTQPQPNQPTPNEPAQPTPGVAELLLAQQNNEAQNSPLALSAQSSKDKINGSTFYNGITVYLFMNAYSMSNKLMFTDTFTVDDFKYGVRGTSSNSQGLSLLNGINKDIYFWVSGNVPGGLYDDATWNRVANNFKALAQAASELDQQGDYNFKGIFFDDESSAVGGFFPFDCEVYGAFTAVDTCTARQSKMSERGKQIMAAMLSVWPDMTWVQLHTPAVSVPGYDDTPLPSNSAKTYGGDSDFEYEDYELAGPFFAGMAEAVLEAKTGSIVSGGNIYKLRDKRDFDAHEIYMNNMGSASISWFPPSLNGDVWKTTVDAGFGVYNKDFPPIPSIPYTDLKVPAEKLKNARCTADELVFLYIEPFEASNPTHWYTDMPAEWRALVEASGTCK